MKVYLKRKDIPNYCTECLFVNTVDNCMIQDDNCMIQDDDNYLDTTTWDEMYAGCPLRAVEDYVKEVKMVRSTGMVRRIDDLGRVVIPKDIQHKIGINEGDPFEIFVEGEAVIFKKYDAANDIKAAIESAKRVVSNDADISTEKSAAVIAKLEEAKRLLE